MAAVESDNSRERRLRLLRATAEQLRELRATETDPSRAQAHEQIGARLQRRFDQLAESLAAPDDAETPLT